MSLSLGNNTSTKFIIAMTSTNTRMSCMIYFINVCPKSFLKSFVMSQSKERAAVDSTWLLSYQNELCRAVHSAAARSYGVPLLFRPKEQYRPFYFSFIPFVAVALPLCSFGFPCSIV